MTSSGSLEGGFSFGTPQEVMHVLASVRQSDVAAKDKNNLRDLILTYTNGGKDPSLKIQIEQLLQGLQIAPIAIKNTSTTPEVRADLNFGSSRNVPAFVPPTAPAVAQTSTPVVPVTQSVPPSPQPAPVTIPTPTPVPTPAPVPPVAEPEPVAPVPPTPPVVEVPKPVVPPQPATPTPPIPSAPVAPSAPPAPHLNEENSTALNRIREIKALVNEKVGNPVNLVDIDNKIGREYMSALLDAMKKLSSGSTSASAMQRLEDAYASVEKIIDNPPAKTDPVEPETPAVPVVPPAPAAIPTPTPVPTPAPVPPVAEPEPVAPVPPTPPVVEVPKPVVPPQPATPTPPIPSAPVVEDKPQPVVVPKPQSAPVKVSEPVKEPKSESETKPRPMPLEDSRWSSAADSIKPVAQASSAPEPIKPLSQSAAPLKTVDDVPVNDPSVEVSSDPLQSKEVSDGLDQLLSDWTLFKKSGLFGTGAKGLQHPLYLKIQSLQIPLLLAGRFEGATQEIKQSITDYMNGWRYEQGIVYEQGETFDHYLRRVIRHILDLQK